MFSVSALLKVSAIALAAALMAANPESASAQGHYGHNHGGGYGNGHGGGMQAQQFGNFGGQPGYGHGGYGCQPAQPQWHNTSHWDTKPGYVWQHGNHMHYQPSQQVWHQTGHWHN